VVLHGEKAQEREVVVDTTVPEKNITFPTDTKLRVKVITRCLKIAKGEIPVCFQQKANWYQKSSQDTEVAS
jgi:hypothetical protein